jgi:predicted Zn-dependent protease
MKYTLALLLTMSLAALAASGCDSAPVTQRKQLIVIPESQERAMGAQAARDILAKERLSRDQAKIEAVKRAGQRIAAVSGEKDMRWEFHVIDNDAVPNAFCLPGGKIFVYSGLFKYVQDEAQLATVVAHEVAHAMARHGAERATLELGAQLGGAILNLALSEEDPRLAEIASRVWGYGSNLGVVLPYSRKQEYEADKIGLHLMAKAGYDMNAAVKFWDNMRKNPQPPKVLSFLSTHPTDEKRIERIKKDIEEIRASQPAA